MAFIIVKIKRRIGSYSSRIELSIKLFYVLLIFNFNVKIQYINEIYAYNIIIKEKCRISEENCS